MNLDLTDEETAALLRELDDLIDGDRYFMSPRIKKAMHRAGLPTQGAAAAPRRHLHRRPTLEEF
jgi:hypothetical protein